MTMATATTLFAPLQKRHIFRTGQQITPKFVEHTGQIGMKGTALQ